MNDKQSEELVIQLTRIADALERMSPPTNDEKKPADNPAQTLDPDVAARLARAPRY